MADRVGALIRPMRGLFLPLASALTGGACLLLNLWAGYPIPLPRELRTTGLLCWIVTAGIGLGIVEYRLRSRAHGSSQERAGRSFVAMGGLFGGFVAACIVFSVAESTWKRHAILFDVLYNYVEPLAFGAGFACLAGLFRYLLGSLFEGRDDRASKGQADSAPNEEAPTWDVFLAHNNLDKPAVEVIAEALQKRGLRPWLDVEEIAPGTWFQVEIQRAIPRVKSAAVFLGPHGLGNFQAVELNAAVQECLDRKIPVIPVFLPGVTRWPDDLPFLKQLNLVRFESLRDEQAIDRLVWGITGRRPDRRR
jgi:hypothetical protein